MFAGGNLQSVEILKVLETYENMQNKKQYSQFKREQLQIGDLVKLLANITPLRVKSRVIISKFCLSEEQQTSFRFLDLRSSILNNYDNLEENEDNPFLKTQPCCCCLGGS